MRNEMWWVDLREACFLGSLSGSWSRNGGPGFAALNLLATWVVRSFASACMLSMVHCRRA